MNHVYQNMPEAGPVTELCYVCRDIEQTIFGWVELVGAGPFFIHEFALDYESEGKRSEVPVIAALGASGSTIIEFIQPIPGSPSLFSERLDGKSASLYALKCEVRNFTAETEKLNASGHELAATLHQWDGGRSDFFGIKTVPFLVKAVKQGSAFDDFPQALRDAHRNWNRKDPIRHLSRLHPRLAFSYGALGLAGT
jgi:methylmalonyl-CoA/ethylmalonyl-CoA epimerase